MAYDTLLVAVYYCKISSNIFQHQI